MRKLLFLVSLLFAAVVQAQPLPGASVNIGRYGGTSTTLGQKTMSASVPVAIASDQSGIAGATGSASVLSTPFVVKEAINQGPSNAVGTASQMSFASHSFKVGDWIYSQTLDEERQVSATTATTVTVSPAFSSAPGNGVYFNLRRLTTPTVYYDATANKNFTLVGGHDVADGVTRALPLTNFGTTFPVSGTVVIIDGGGSISVDDNGGSLTVDGTVAATQSGSWTNACTQSGTWNINNVSGTVSLPTGASTAALQTTGNTSLSSIDGKLPALSSSRVPVEAVGNIAHGASDSGNPVKTGYKGRTANPTAVSDGQRVDALGDKLGRGIYGLGCLPENEFSGVSGSDITNTTSTSVVSAGGAGVKYAVYCITVSNMHASSAARVDIRDGTTTKWSCPAAAGGGGCAVCSPVPFFTGTANTALQAQASASATIRVSLSGCKVP